MTCEYSWLRVSPRSPDAANMEDERRKACFLDNPGMELRRSRIFVIVDFKLLSCFGNLRRNRSSRKYAWPRYGPSAVSKVCEKPIRGFGERYAKRAAIVNRLLQAPRVAHRRAIRRVGPSDTAHEKREKRGQTCDIAILGCTVRIAISHV